VLFGAFICLTKQGKHLAKNWEHNAFRKWTLLYDNALLVLFSAFLRFFRLFKQKKQICGFPDGPQMLATVDPPTVGDRDEEY